MNTPAKLILTVLGLAALPLSAMATDFEDYGRVTRVQPRIERVRTPREECRNEYVQVPVEQARSGNNGGGAVLGAIVGGLLGNQVGHGNGRAAATAAGVIGGAVAGDRIEGDERQLHNPPQQGYQEQQVRQCRTVEAVEERTNGYEVSYDYRGRSYMTVLPRDPGQRVRLRVSVEPDMQQ